jgi:hypothetical protein
MAKAVMIAATSTKSSGAILSRRPPERTATISSLCSVIFLSSVSSVSFCSNSGRRQHEKQRNQSKRAEKS